MKRNSVFVVIAMFLCSCSNVDYTASKKQIENFLKQEKFVLPDTLRESVRKVQEICPEPSCIVYVTDVGCSSCIFQIIKDFISMKDYHSEVNVWIVPSDETSTLQIRYYLNDRKDDLGLSDIPFRYFVMEGIIASSVREGLYRFSNGKLANVLLVE